MASCCLYKGTNISIFSCHFLRLIIKILLINILTFNNFQLNLFYILYIFINFLIVHYNSAVINCIYIYLKWSYHHFAWQKKVNWKNITNYRPINLLNNTYKLFAKIITSLITGTLDENHPIEQTKFRKGFSTIDHLHIQHIVHKKEPRWKSHEKS